MAEFKKPTDVTRFWKAPHCGPGTTDPDEMCGFCGDPNWECARICTEAVNAGLIVTGNGDVEGREEICGGSGFWCRGCGRFWAMDVCGDSDCETHTACDGAELGVSEGYVRCVCGHRLMKALEG